MSDTPQEVWLTVDMVAAHANRDVAAIRVRCKSGVYPNAIKEANVWRIPMGDLDLSEQPEGMTALEVGKLMDLNPAWIGKMCRTGKLPGVFWHRKWYIRREDAEAYMEKRKDLYHVRYDILRDRDKLWQCYVDSGHSFRQACTMCGCGQSTFRAYFYKAGLSTRMRTPQVTDNGYMQASTWRSALKNAYKKVSRIPDKCPRNCPGWMAEPDCCTEGEPCIFDPEQVPLDTTYECRPNP